MSASVYLFADFGRGPRVLGNPFGARPTREECERRHLYRYLRQPYGATRAWWLVECESAAAGQETIAAVVAERERLAVSAFGRPCEPAPIFCNQPGRILDSGTSWG